MKIDFSALIAASTLALAHSALAAPVEYVMDKDHTHIGMTWNHLGFSDFRARFDDFDGTLVLDAEAPENSRVEVTIPIDSIDTRVPRLDEHLESADFFDVAKFPTASFRSTRVDGRASAHPQAGRRFHRGGGDQAQRIRSHGVCASGQ